MPFLVYLIIKLIILLGLSAFEATTGISDKYGVPFEVLWENLPDKYK